LKYAVHALAVDAEVIGNMFIGEALFVKLDDLGKLVA
jgi:hypothetical protein